MPARAQDDLHDPVLRPIFILSPLPRCGTNYLWEILRRHPHATHGRAPVWEDYLVKNAHHLVAFSESAHASWDPVWGSTEHLRPELLRSVGEGVLRFLSHDPARRAVTKSPTISNIESFFDVFPTADLVVLVRDGRDVVASGMRTFGWTLEEGAAAWSHSTQRALDFIAANEGRRVHLMRFEDLQSDPASVVPGLLHVVGLDPALYDLGLLEEIPVRGSSAERGGADNVHWHPVGRPAGFRPVGRWREWPDADIARFEAIAGPALARLDYALATLASPEPSSATA